jgi:hypothetical protein
VDGRKLVLAYALDDGGNPTTFTQLAHTVIQQDHAFAVGTSTNWFTPNLFVETKTPTYGYNVSGNWNGPLNLFAAGGSIQNYVVGADADAYLIKHTNSKSVAIISYGPAITASYASCHTVGQVLSKAGINVSYDDLDAPLAGSYTSAVQKMQQAQYKSLMQGVYMDVNGTVPFTAVKTFPGKYPGVQQYLATMQKYEPKFVYSQEALQGYESAALLAAGIQAAGSNLTQQNVINQTNKLANFTAGGVSDVQNWTIAHTTQCYPSGASFVQVKGGQFVPVLGKGSHVFLCFPKKVNLKNPVPATNPTGTPGG